jgi:hypothetical protein
MSLQTRLASLITAVGADVKHLYSHIPGEQEITTSTEVFSRLFVNANVGLTAGVLSVSFFTAEKNQTITQLTMANGTVGVGTTLARMGLWLPDSTAAASITLLAETASDTALSTSTGVLTRSLNSARGGPTSYNLVAGTRYGVSFLPVGSSTDPKPYCHQALAAMHALDPCLVRGKTGQTDHPAIGATLTTLAARSEAYWFSVS